MRGWKRRARALSLSTRRSCALPSPPPRRAPRAPRSSLADDVRTRSDDEASVASFLAPPVVSWTQFDDPKPAPLQSHNPAPDHCHLSQRADTDGLPESLAAYLSRPDRALPEPPPQRRARWRRLLARQDLVEKHLGGRTARTPRAPVAPPVPDRPTDDEASPRSSLDLDEPRSNLSWDDSLEPPSPTLRSWRSCSSRSFRPRTEERPRALAAIGRQHCMNDISHLVDAANSPCISYDRQIFDPVSKLWRYVEADEPTSSPWELGPPSSLGSPVTTRSATPAGAVAASPSLPTPSAMHAAAARRKVPRSDTQAAVRGMGRRPLMGASRSQGLRPWSPSSSGASHGQRSPMLARTSSADRRRSRFEDDVPLSHSNSHMGVGSWRTGLVRTARAS